MSPLATVCHRHGRLIPSGRRCPACIAQEAPRRSARNRDLGRNSAHWRRLSKRLITQAGGICPVCGGLETPEDPGSKLTCDRVGGGDHSRASVEDCEVACRRCHGRADGGRR